jgi:indolepyruvate ferredoxin oxidoreductase beta subunit
MKYDIIIAGVGGQGILTIATVLGRATVEKGWRLKQAEVHGMSQRGGAVQSHVRMADREIYSDVIPRGQADMILSMEPMESLRYMEWLQDDGWVITCADAVENISEYPDTEAIYAEIRKWKRHILLEGLRIAGEAGSSRALNMVMLGAAAAMVPLEPADLHSAITQQFGPKGQNILDTNIKAFNTALEFAQQRKNMIE